MVEIGSEFWTIEPSKFDIRFFLSGRTALDFIIRDILAEREICTVHMPSFCCHTMIEPFVRNKIPVLFYDVFFENGILTASVPKIHSNDIFFCIKYFGYEKQEMGNLPEIKNSGCIVIEDTTHSWLMYSEKADEPSLADYSFASFRKWTGFTGVAAAKKENGKFLISQKCLINEEYEALRKDAQEKKRLYIQSFSGNKQDFLEKFSAAEAMLENDYLDYQPTAESISALICLDKKKIKNRRRKNAKILLDGISEIKGITPMFSKLGPHDSPLCVPVIIDSSVRDNLRRYLISQQIYCPVHWPLSPLHNNISGKAKEIYNLQLSLVCDQRYDTEDMVRLVKSIKSFFGV
ncbi:MAG: hypothetical protein IJW15_00260 [Clostridia bacterium]|nr:hypothetical protein [Clostridia bacterium]